MNVIESMEKRVSELETIIRRKERLLQKAPSGTVRICVNGKRVQYYHRPHSSETNGSYIRKRDRSLAEALAQKDYDSQVLHCAKREREILQNWLRQNYPATPLELYEDYSPYRKALIVPDEISDEEFAARWQQQAYGRKEFREDAPEYYTDRGEQVRSKSEVLIANALAKMGVPYHYEKPLELTGLGTIHPDFTVLHKTKRTTLYLEHLGMMDDPEYCHMALERLTCYEKNGIYPVKQLILFHETMRHPLNMKLVHSMIQAYCIDSD